MRAKPGSRQRWRRPGRLGEAASLDGGFVLLLAFFGALVLLLSSLSIQSAVLKSRSSEFSLWRRRQHDDALASAAQLLAVGVAAYPCALGLRLADWSTPPTPEEEPCIAAEDLEPLRQLRLPDPDDGLGTFELRGYEPITGASGSVDTADLTLRWTPSQGRVIERRCRVLLAAAVAGGPLRLQGVRP